MCKGHLFCPSRFSPKMVEQQTLLLLKSQKRNCHFFCLVSDSIRLKSKVAFTFVCFLIYFLSYFLFIVIGVFFITKKIDVNAGIDFILRFVEFGELQFKVHEN